MRRYGEARFAVAKVGDGEGGREMEKEEKKGQEEGMHCERGVKTTERCIEVESQFLWTRKDSENAC